MKQIIEWLYRKPGQKNDSAPGLPTFTADKTTVDMGNKVFNKDYQGAIDMGLKALESAPNDPMVHINLMDAYHKGKDLDPSYLDKSTEHARLAILYGHHTGLAEYRLAVNLEKKKCYYQALQLYDLILNTPGFHFSPHGVGNTIDFRGRKEKALAKLPKAQDSASDTLFSAEEINYIISGIESADRAEEWRQKEIEARLKKLKGSILRG